MNVIVLIAVYLLVINLIGFIMMGVDKSRARKRAWRIPEAQLFVIALIGGSIGSIIGMYTFHHKTRHRIFVFGMPVILALQIIAVAALILSPLEFSVF